MSAVDFVGSAVPNVSTTFVSCRARSTISPDLSRDTTGVAGASKSAGSSRAATGRDVVGKGMTCVTGGKDDIKFRALYIYILITYRNHIWSPEARGGSRTKLCNCKIFC